MRPMLVVICFAIFTASAFAADSPPGAVFSKTGVTVTGLNPGTKVAWIGIVAEPRGYHTRLRVTRGFQTAANTSLEIAEPEADRTQSLWTIVDVGRGKGVNTHSPRTAASTRSISIDARVGQPVVEVRAAAVEMLYVRPPANAWHFTVSDGADFDADGVQNGVIVVRLSAMKPLQGNPHPPDSTKAGDVVLVLDPSYRRSAMMEVQP